MTTDLRRQTPTRERLSDDALAVRPVNLTWTSQGTVLEPQGFFLRIPNRKARLVVTIPQAQDTARLMPAVTTLAQLLSLPPNWDSYGAPAIEPEAVASAARILEQTLASNAPMPDIVPTNRGGVQMEWHENGIDLEVEIAARGDCLVFFRDRLREVETESEAGLYDPLLRECLVELSRRSQP